MDVIKKYPMLFHNDSIHNSELYDQAWVKANQAAEILKRHYSANKVILFGSLLHKTLFDATSDIDLAVSGIPESRFYDVVGTVLQAAAPFEVDLVDIDFNTAPFKHLQSQVDFLEGL